MTSLFSVQSEISSNPRNEHLWINHRFNPIQRGSEVPTPVTRGSAIFKMDIDIHIAWEDGYRISSADKIANITSYEPKSYVQEYPEVSEEDTYIVEMSILFGTQRLEKLALFHTTDGFFMPLKEKADSGEVFMWEHHIELARAMDRMRYGTGSTPKSETVLSYIRPTDHVKTLSGELVRLDEDYESYADLLSEEIHSESPSTTSV